MSGPMVSVVLATYNRADRLGSAVASVLGQTLPDFELIIVDDGSTDGTASVLAALSDSRVRILTHGSRRGPSAARNTGLRVATAPFVAFQDSDDVWSPAFLERLLAGLEAGPPETVLAFCRFVRVTRAGGHLNPLPAGFSTDRIADHLRRANVASCQTVLIPRRHLDRAGGFDESFPALVDWDLFLRLSDIGPFVLVDEPLAWITIGPDGITRNPRLLVAGLEHLIEKHRWRFDRDPRALAKLCLTTGGLLCQTGEVRRGRQRIRQALTLDRYSPEAWATFALTVLGWRAYRRAADARRWWVAQRTTMGYPTRPGGLDAGGSRARTEPADHS